MVCIVRITRISAKCVRYSLSSVMHGYAVYVQISVNKRTIRIHALLMTENSISTLHPSDAFQNGATLTQRDELLNKCRYFYFLCVQKVFSSLHKVQIEPLMADGLF